MGESSSCGKDLTEPQINITTSDAAPAPTTCTNVSKEDVDAEVWDTFHKSISQVQAVLNRNRLLIQQVSDNHQSRLSENLVKNVALIQELNKNVSNITFLYSDLSSNLCDMVQQRNSSAAGTAATKEAVVNIDVID